MQNSKYFPGTMPQTLVFGKRKVCFRSPKMYQSLLQQCRIPKEIWGRTPVFWEGEVEVASSWNYVWLRICQPSTIEQQRYNMQNNQLEKSNLTQVTRYN